ncbi:MAG: hypothetical protein Q4E13_00400 [Clostridia bacterium]|nr:hypothetical protein [Clostridia bacterium]
MDHLYFLKSLHWTAVGTYHDGDGNTYPLRGRVRIIRNAEQWTLDGYLEVLSNPPARFTNDYHIRATDRAETLAWESYNPALGILRGTFEFIDDAILSFYHSEDGSYSGTETLLLNANHSYFNVGVSFHNGRKMSSWTAKLTIAPEQDA